MITVRLHLDSAPDKSFAELRMTAQPLIGDFVNVRAGEPDDDSPGAEEGYVVVARMWGGPRNYAELAVIVARLTTAGSPDHHA